MSTLPHSTSQEALLAQQAFLRRLARSLVADEHRAEDLAQEAALEALRAGPERLGAMRAWLRRVVRNLASDAARGERRRAAREEHATPPPAPLAPDELVQRLQVQRRVLEALEHLDEPYRATLFLRYWDDLAPSVIAARTGVPVSTVKSRLARGLARLRAELDEGHGGERGAWAVTLAAGLEGWERTTLGAAAAAGGIAMGVKLALGSVAACAVIAATWWALRPPAGPRTPESVASATLVEGVGNSGGLREPRGGQRVAVDAQPLTLDAPPVAARDLPEWLLELEIRGQHPADSGPVSVVVSVPGPDAPSVELTHQLLETSCRVDVGPLFSLDEDRRGADAGGTDPLQWQSVPRASHPGVLHLALDHPQYLPLEADVLVPEELRRPDASRGEFTAVLELVRAKAVVTGTVSIESGKLPARSRVALHAMEEEQPNPNPVERVRPAADGSFRLRADEADDHVVIAYVEPQNSGAPSGVRPEARLVTLTPGETRNLDPIVLGEGATITGRVSFSGHGELLPGHVQMHLRRPGADGQGPSNLVWVEGRYETWNANVPWDEQGRFRLTGLAEREYALVPIVLEAEDVPSRSAIKPIYEIKAPAADIDLVINGLRVTFSVVDRFGAPRRANFQFSQDDSPPFEGCTTNRAGLVRVILDPSRPMSCRVDDGVHAVKQVHLLPHELAGGGPIEITIDDVELTTATLAIHKGPRARKLAEGMLLDVRILDRSDERAMSLLGGVTSTTTGRRAVVSAPWQHRQPRMETQKDGTQLVTDLLPGSYVVVLSPRSASPDRACFLLPAELELELHPGERVDHEWEPEVGGTLRVNFIGSGAREASFCNLEGHPLIRWQTSGSPPGVKELGKAVPPGPYALHIELEEGGERIVPVHIVAGRVNDVEIDLGAL